jgi:hypothetical protein
MFVIHMRLQTPANSQFEIPTLMKISPRLSFSLSHLSLSELSLSLSLFPTQQTSLSINNIAVFNPILKNKPLVLTGVALDTSVINSVHYAWTLHLFDMCLTP